jgi:ATP-dependent RNA helicase DeaD
MLDMGFTPQIEQILEFVPKKRQTLLFSATLPKRVMLMAETYLQNPVRVSLAATPQVSANLKQDVLHVSEADKHSQLLVQLEKREGSVIVFVKTKFSAERIAKRLQQENHSADAIHGNLNHRKRELTLIAFRDCKYRIMVATDVAARGLDIAHVKHVINYDLPQCPEDYIHRIGRTARAGAEGSAVCFVTPADRGKWNAINRLMSFGEETSAFMQQSPQEKKRVRKSPYSSAFSSASKPRKSSFASPSHDRFDRADRAGGWKKRSFSKATSSR